MISTERLEQATAYVLGALEDEDRLAFELALNDSAELQREVAELQEVAGLVALAVRPVAPPAALRERIVSDAKAVRPIAPRLAEAAQQRRDPSPPTPLRAVSGPAAADRWSMTRLLGGLAVAASLVGMIVMQNKFREADARAQALAQAVDQLRAQVGERDAQLGAMIGPQVETIRLSSSGTPPSARMYWNRASRQLVLVTFALPTAPSGRTYQLWGIAKGQQPVSLGTFNTAANGTGQLSIRVPDGLDIATGAVTEEPEGGSPQPTTTPILAGNVGAT
ncbi:MAG: anti-sigma factor [Gemmatimonadaceae bacterium]